MGSSYKFRSLTVSAGYSLRIFTSLFTSHARQKKKKTWVIPRIVQLETLQSLVILQHKNQTETKGINSARFDVTSSTGTHTTTYTWIGYDKSTWHAQYINSTKDTFSRTTKCSPVTCVSLHFMHTRRHSRFSRVFQSLDVFYKKKDICTQWICSCCEVLEPF